MFYETHHLGSPDYLKVETGRDFSFPPHLHQCFEVIIILNGEMKVTVDSQDHILRKNEALLIFPNQIHSLESEHSEHILCIFSPRLVQAYSTKVAGKLPLSHKFTVDEYLINALRCADASESAIEKKGVLYLLCGRFDAAAEYQRRQTQSGSLLYRIFAFVEENFSSECTLSELSEGIGYEYSYLSRFFKRATGISFNSYVNQRRLSGACYLLENTELPIIRCAFESGYTSLRSFNRVFKEHFGITPSSFRKNYGKN